MVKMKDLLKKEIKGDIGLEIEMEGSRLPWITDDYWDTKEEGSLRGGLEYVTKGAIEYGQSYKIIENLFSKLDRQKHYITDSDRTSTHVHYNITELRPSQVWLIIMSYWLLENAFFELFHDNRKSNGFCLRLKDAEGLILQASKDIQNKDLFHFNGEMIRYAGLNTSAIRQHGSVEYRGMHGTLDKDEIQNWVTMLYVLNKRTVLNYSNPEEFMDFCYHKGPESIMDKVFYPSQKVKLNQLTNLKSLIEENLERIFDLAYLTDWDAYDMKAENLVKSKSKKTKPNNSWEDRMRTVLSYSNLQDF